MIPSRVVRVARGAVAILALGALVLVVTPAWGQGLPESLGTPRGLAQRPGVGSFPWETIVRIFGLVVLIVVIYMACFHGWFRSMLNRGDKWPMDAYGRTLFWFSLLIGASVLALLWPLLELKVLVPSLRRSPDLSNWMNHWLLRLVIVPGLTLLFAFWGLFMHRSNPGVFAVAADDE